MVDKNAQDKQLDSMTDKVVEKEMAVSGAAVENLQTQAPVEPSFIVPSKQDMELLQKTLGSAKFEVIDCYTRAEGDFEATVSGLLRTF